MFIEENGYFKGKKYKVSFSFFLSVVLIIALLVIGYICSNIFLMRLGYRTLELEQKKELLLAEKAQLEYSVENLSSLTRIEEIACKQLGMHRPERIEFIAMVPAGIDNFAIASNTQKEERTEKAGYLEAGTFLGEIADLKIFQNQ